MRLLITGLIRGAIPVLCLVLSVDAAATAAPPYVRAGAVAGPRGTAPAGGDSARSLNVYQRRLVERYTAGASAVTDDTLRVVAFQVQFADSLMGGQVGSNRPEVRDSLFFARELEHLTDYYRGASRGHLEVAWTLDATLYTLPKEMGYYGRDAFEETRVVELAQAVIGMADASVDFADFDHVFIIHAGAGQETDQGNDSRGQIWSSFYDSSDIDAAFPDTTVAGLATGDSLGGEPFVVDNFSIVPSDASQDYTIIGTLGIWAFELGNRIGLLPLFDSTPSGVPDSQGVGSFCVMSYGLFNVNGFIPSFPCAFNRVIAGWVDPVTVEPAPAGQPIRLTDINTGGPTDTVCVKIPITETEYYLVVNRVHDANFDSLFSFVDRDSDLVPDNADSLGGAEFDFFLTDITNPAVRRYLPEYGFNVLLRHTGSGVYVWHVDEGVVRETIAAGFIPNDFVDRKGVDLEEADGVQDMDAGGVPAFALGSFFDSYRAGDGNRTAFGPSTEPRSHSNAGVPTGIVVENVSTPGHRMTCTVRLESAHTDHRVRWGASTSGQPPSVVDLDGTGASEIVVLGDGGNAYAFNGSGGEFVDADADPSTIEPLFDVDGEWAGPPAFANLDGGGDTEIVAATTDGVVHLWRSTLGATALFGNLPSALPMAAPPLLVDMRADGVPEIAIVQRDGDSLQVQFVDAAGVLANPVGDAFVTLWPLRVQGQLAAPMALAGTSNQYSAAKQGIVLAWVDTVDATAWVTYVPALYPNGVTLIGEPVAGTWRSRVSIPAGVAPGSFRLSAPATGDIDADGHDEVVVTTSDGRLIIYENEAAETGGAVHPTVVTLRAGDPSAPALGDVDLDGTLEIAVWDAEFMYLLESNGRLVTGWPRRIVPERFGEQPPRTIHRGLESPLVADVDGDGAIEALFPLEDGSIQVFGFDGASAPGFPRVGPAGATAAPSVAALAGSGELSLLALGTVSAIRRVETVADSFETVDEATLSIQSLAGSGAGDRRYWASSRNGPMRQGLVTESVALKTVGVLVDAGSFMVYPNPVSGGVVHARVTLNRGATVRVEIYNLEGEETFARSFAANANDLIGTPFDEAVDVSAMVSGVYFVRLVIDGAEGSQSMTKPFAIRR